MSRRVVSSENPKPETGKRRLRIVDPFAALLWSGVLLVTVALAVLSAQTGFNGRWYGDVLTMLDWIVGILALINLLATLSAGIRMTDGIADIGRDADGKRNSFEAVLLRDVTVADSAGETLSADMRRWRNASLRFHLKDGTVRQTKPASVLTARQLRAVKRFFGLTTDRS